jgi:HPt (histidine-containing phosphotransfer) domain-containing protein
MSPAETNDLEMLSLNEDFLELIRSDKEFHSEICSLFEQDGTRLLADMKAALEAASREGLYQAAHALKGIFSNTGFENLKAFVLPMMAVEDDDMLKVMQSRFLKDMVVLEEKFTQASSYLRSL